MTNAQANDMYFKRKRKETFRLIEIELCTYKESKKCLEQLAREVDEIAASVGSSWPEIGKIEIGENEKICDFVNCKSPGQVSDPTYHKAIELMLYKNRVLSSWAIAEMARRVEAIDKLLENLRAAAEEEERIGIYATNAKLKLQLIEEKYFKRILTDEGIQAKLIISSRTFYRWRRQIIEEIAKLLGWVV